MTIVRAAGLAVLAIAGSVHAAGTPAQVCAAAELKAAAKAANARLACHAKAALRGADVDPTCLAKADDKLAAAFAKAEATGGCVSNGRAGLVDAVLDSSVGAFVAAVRPTPDANRCAAATLEAIGKDALGELGCHAAAAKRGGAVAAACLANADARLASAFAKAEGKPPCPTSGDAAAIATSVNELVDDVVAALPTTTTTTTIPSGDSCPCYIAQHLANVPTNYFDLHGGAVCSDERLATADTCSFWFPGSSFPIEVSQAAIGVNDDDCMFWAELDFNGDGTCDSGPGTVTSVTPAQREACIQLLHASAVYESACP
jgi:hypothetical protein